MKRRLVLILLLLVGGAIVNVGVAWGFVRFVPMTLDLPNESQVLADELGWFDEDWSGAPTGESRSVDPPEQDEPVMALQPRNAGARIECIGWPRSSVSSRLIIAPLAAPMEAFITRAGWPMFAVVGGRSFRATHERAIWGVVSAGEFAPLPLPRDLPFRPLWPGFAINTVFYAAMLWLLFVAAFALRRRILVGRRLTRGLCVKCGYDLRNRASDSSVCSECGAPFTR